MKRASWLKGWWQGKQSAQRRSAVATGHVAGQSEPLESRQLLSVSTLFIPATGELNIQLDADDSVRVGASTGNVLIEVASAGGAFTPINSLGTVPASSVQSIVILGSDEPNTIDLNGVTAASFTANPTIDVDGANGDDRLIGSLDLADSLSGGDGNDTINGQGGDDTLVGGNGGDAITAGTGDDSIRGGDGHDAISGDAGSDTIESGDGDDTVSGGADNDSVFAGNGQDSVNGDAGDDTLNGDGGTDTVSGDAGNDSILGGEFADSLLGGDGNDTINGQGGNDTVDGEAGEDNLLGGAGNDSVSGGDGNDTFNGMAGNDTLNGGGGNDTMFGGAGLDSLSGDSGSDSILGQAGRDTLNGGGGADLLDGGADDDLVQTAGLGSATSLPLLSISDFTLSAEGSTPPLFLPAVSFVIGTGAGAGPAKDGVTSADFDRDGDLDVAVTSRTQEVRVMFNSGTGTFTAGPPLTIGDFSLDITSADLDGDGDIDIATTNASDANVSVLLNNGNGTFAAQTLVNLQRFSFPRGIIAADVDGDGDNDLLTANNVADTVSILVNDGAGSFPTRTDIALPDAVDLVARDFDGDGDLDLAVVSDSTDRLSILRNNGGTFANPVIIATGNNPITMGAADFDGDGDQDVVIGTNFDNTVRLFLNDGTASFAENSTSSTTGSIGDFNLAIGDFNGDSNPDVAFGNRNVFNEVNVFLGNGAGQLGAGIGINLPNAGDTGGPLVAGDFDADGNTDLAMAGIVTDLLYFLRNTGLSTSIPTATFTVQLSRPSTLPVSVAFSTADGLAQAGLDYQATSGSLTFAPGVTSQTITVRLPFDDVAEPTENFFVNLTGATNAQIADAQGQGRIFDDDGGIPGPTLSINNITIDPEGNTGTSMAVLTVSLSAASAQPITVGFTTGDDTAQAGIDFVPVNGLLNFAPGVLTQTITVPIIGELSFEPDESFLVHLFNPVSVVLSTTSGRVTLINDDPVEPSNSTLLGGLGNDTLIGADGDELLNGQAGNDSLLGGGGNDSMLGGGGQDTLDGEIGDDTLNGQGANDTLLGGLGDDTFVLDAVGGGVDSADGGEGFNTIQVTGTALADTITVSQLGGILVVGVGGGSISATANIQCVLIDGANGNDLVTVGSINSVAALKLDVRGGSGNDLLDGTGANLGRVRMSLSGDAGNDTINGSLGNDTMNGGSGNDSMCGWAGNDTMIGGTGDDSMGGSLGNDSINGGDGADSLNGQQGDDRVDGGLGNDTLKGDDGNDTLLGGVGDDNLNGMAGHDSITGGVGVDALVGGTGNDTLDGGRNNDTISGNAGDDRIRGDHGNDFINAGDGSNTVNGGHGDDTIVTGIGNDFVDGDDGNDWINTGDGDDLIVGGDGSDSIQGGGGQDILLGGDGDDSLNGNGGTDTIAGQQGNDIIVDPLAEIHEAFTLGTDILAILSAA